MSLFSRKEKVNPMFMYQTRRKKQSIWSTLVILNVLGLGLGSLVGFSYLTLPQLTKLAQAQAQAQDHVTALPWITSEKDCKGEFRIWIDGACWDEEHDASF